MAVTIDNTNKPLIPRGDDQSPKGYNRAELYTGKALDFDGVNDYVDGGTLDITDYTQMSVSLYMNVDTTTQDFRLISIRYSGADDIRIFHSVSIGGGVLNFSLDDGDVDNIGVNFETNKWYHVVMTHDGTTLKAYFNGVEQASTASTFDYANADGLFYIGRYTGGSVTFYDGEASNVKIFNTALTAAQVADLYNNPEKVVPTGVADSALKLWLPMMEGAGTTAYDGSGNGNHGTISGATWTHGIGAPVSQTAVIDWNKTSNLVAYSEEFDNAYWTKQFITITANDTTSPDGQDTADKITPSASTDTHYLYSPYSFNNENTFSVFAKYNGYNIGLRPSGLGYGKAFVNFDLQNGTILGSGGTDYEDSSITSFGDGWYRISMTMDNAASHGINFYAVNGTTATELPSFTADGTSGFYLWGAQVNAGATLEPYVRTFTSNKTSPVLLPQGLTSGRDITGVNLFENVRKQGALNLDGNSWAEVHDNASLDMTDGISLECWVYWNGGISDKGILGRYVSATPGPLLYVNSATSLLFFAATNVNLNYTSMTTGWRHIVGTYNKVNSKLYVDGALVNTGSQTDDINLSANPFAIGRYNNETSKCYPNDIAQPRIYNRALTAEEVQTNYDKGKDIFTN